MKTKARKHAGQAVKPVAINDNGALGWWVGYAPQDPVSVQPGKAPEGVTQAEWDRYCRDVVRAWRKRPFKESEE
jgi:hypothetical protein